MLLSLSIKNYALIQDLQVEFRDGLSIITGETGAGKSILLGGLALVLGRRADTSLVYDKEQKCVIEAEFGVGSYGLQELFAENDLDYSEEILIRREILPNGKSRAFVNDTPVNLELLSGITGRLIDIHSQHETLQLSEADYQFRIIDSIAENGQLLQKYRDKFQNLRKLVKDLDQMREDQAAAMREYDYNQYICQELESAGLLAGEQEELEEASEKLFHLEEIKERLSEITELSDAEPYGILSLFSRMRQGLSRISGYSDAYRELSERIESLWIELKDILSDVESENEELIHDPETLSQMQDRLQLIYDLQKKHLVSTVEELLEVAARYREKLNVADSADVELGIQEKEIAEAEETLRRIGREIRVKREEAIPVFISQVESLLQRLEMKNTRLRITLSGQDELLSNGMDRMEFLLSSDKGKTFEKLKNVASGGEMSRMMLTVKCILSRYSELPAIIFDEIDAGVSGEVSNRIAEVMREMSRNMQVITITHLPQVAAKGKRHYKVYKEETPAGIASRIRLLSDDERLVELAEMLGGARITDSALAHARQLLQ